MRVLNVLTQKHESIDKDLKLDGIRMIVPGNTDTDPLRVGFEVVSSLINSEQMVTLHPKDIDIVKEG